MRFNRHLILPIAAVALLGGCRSDNDSSQPTPPAPLPVASVTTTVTNPTNPVQVTLSTSTQVTIDPDGAASLISIYGTGAKVEVSQNDSSKYPASATTALGAIPANQSLISVYAMSFSAPGALVVGEAQASPEQAPAEVPVVPANSYPVPIRFYYMPPTPAQAIPAGTIGVYLTSNAGTSWTNIGTLTITADMPQLISGTLNLPFSTTRMTIVFRTLAPTTTTGGN